MSYQGIVLQLQTYESSYIQKANGERSFTVTARYDWNIGLQSWKMNYNENQKVFYQFSKTDGTVIKLEQQNKTLPYPNGTLSFTLTDNTVNHNILSDDTIRVEIYIWNNNNNALSYTASAQETLQTIATVPESASIGFTGITTNSVLVYWQPNKDGGSPITGYGLTIKNEDNNQTILQKTVTGTNFKVENLESNTNYKAYIFVTNAIGNSFEQSFGFKTKSDIITAPEPTPEPEPTPAPIITYCVNVYTLDSGGNVLSDHYDSINITKFQQLTNEGKYVFLCEDGIIPTEQQVRNFYGYTAPVEDSSINSTMVSQSVGSFILKDGILKGEILYIANQAQYNNENKLISGFNPFYYSEIKNLISFVQINSKSGIPLITKPNGLNFTATERDERIQIDEGHAGELKNYKEITIDFLVLKSPSDMRAFASNKQIQVIEEPPPDEPKPCQVGYHKDFSGKCVPDDPLPEIPRDKLIDTLKGFLFGTVALSLLARKY